MTEAEQVKLLTDKIIELWWPDTPEADTYNAEVTVADLEHYAALAADYILQREAALLKVVEAARVACHHTTVLSGNVSVPYELYRNLTAELEAYEKGRTP